MRWAGVESRLFNSKACGFSDSGLWMQKQQMSTPARVNGRVAPAGAGAALEMSPSGVAWAERCPPHLQHRVPACRVW